MGLDEVYGACNLFIGKRHDSTSDPDCNSIRIRLSQLGCMRILLNSTNFPVVADGACLEQSVKEASENAKS